MRTFLSRPALVTLGAALSLLAASAQAQSPAAAAPAASAAAAQASAAARAPGLWIDVRTPKEFAEGHLQGALNIPVEDIASRIAQVSPDKNAPVNLYCRSGRRAEAAREELLKLGYTQVTNHGAYKDLAAQEARR